MTVPPVPAGTAATIVVVAILTAVYLTVRRRRARAAAAAAAAQRIADRIAADRAIVNGDVPLPPGVDLSDAYRHAAAAGIPLADAAFDLHRTETLEILRRAFRPPRPGD